MILLCDALRSWLRLGMLHLNAFIQSNKVSPRFRTLRTLSVTTDCLCTLAHEKAHKVTAMQENEIKQHKRRQWFCLTDTDIWVRLRLISIVHDLKGWHIVFLGEEHILEAWPSLFRPPLSGCLINVMNLGKKRSDLFSCSCNFLWWDERYSQGSLPSSSVIFILTQIEPRLHLVSLLCKPLLRLIISHSDDDTRADVLATHGCSPLKLSFSLYTSFLCELLAAVLGFRRQLHLLSLADNEIYLLFFFIQHLLVLSK